jgi:hypothetical protein
MNLCLPSLKKWGHCVAGLLISVKLHVTRRTWHESPLAFCPNFGICVQLNMVHLGIVCILIQVSNQFLMENMKNGQQQSSQEQHAFNTSFKLYLLRAWRYTFINS